MWGKMDESGENVCPPHASSPRQNFFHKHDFIIFYNFICTRTCTRTCTP